MIACANTYSTAQSNKRTEQAEQANASAAAVPRDEYRLGPEDQITITVRFADELNNKTVPIDSAGYINIPFAGRVSAAGLTVAELQTSLAKKLTPYFAAPQVVINIAQYGSKPVAVMGEVHNPAVHQLRGRETLMQLLSASGGLTQEAGSKLEITRQMVWGELPLPNARVDSSGTSSTVEVDLSALLSGNESENILLCSNDTVTVPRAKLIYVLGEVHKPGGFPLHETETASVLQALALAEGPLGTASTEHARILRMQSNGVRQEIPVNLRNILEREQPDISLKPEDVLYLPNSKAKSATLRAVEAAIQMGTGVVVWGRF
ncbi:MAG: polysaccharide export protein [Acidobacteriota bacterium]|nr:polysaccharide export protein [Acidobacteriota bacterium]